MADELDKTLPQEVPEAVAPSSTEPPDEAVPEALPVDETTARPMPEATEALPEPVEAPDPGEPEPDEATPAPKLSDIGADLGSWAKERAASMGAFLSAHRLATVLVLLACVGAILGVVLFGIQASQMPPDDLIAADVRERLSAPAHTASPYEIDEPLVLQSVDVSSKRTSGTRRDACEVSAVAVFANSGMETRAEAELTYVRKGESWSCAAASADKVSHHATAGVDQQRVIDHSSDLLLAADSSEDGRLDSFYRDASVNLVSENFVEDAQTDSLILHYASQGTFVSYECDLTAHFRFVPASGAWELTETFVSDNAYDLGFGPLIGTWQGTFASQQSTSQKCLAARDANLTVNITQAKMGNDGDATIEGTLTGIAHLHADLSSDATQTEGDQLLEAAPFTGHISSGNVEQDIISLLAGNSPKSEQAGIVFDCTTQDIAGGAVTLTLTFGTSNAPDSAAATLTSTHSYEDYFLLIPYQREARFADSFTLVKAEQG